jgi:hypothetical protein
VSRRKPSPKISAAIVTAVAAILTAVSLNVVLGTDERGHPTITLKVEHNLHSENPAGVSAKQLDAIRDQQDALAATDQLPIIAPDAAPSFPGCVTRLIDNNYSSRRGVKPRVIIDHYTVSANRPGWGDVYSIADFFNRPATQASSHFIIDGEGHCLYIVPVTQKAWTEAAANPVSVGIEVINTGREAAYLAPAGKAKLAQVHVTLGKLLGLPMQRAILRNCVVARPGITDHNSLGPCGGGHHDITPFNVDEQIAAAVAYKNGHKPTLPVYEVTKFLPHVNGITVRTDRPGNAVGRAVKQGYTRVRVVKVG